MRSDAGENHCTASRTAGVVTRWKMNHDIIANAFAQAGYDIPELINWDLSNPQEGHGITAPATSEGRGHFTERVLSVVTQGVYGRGKLGGSRRKGSTSG